MINSENGTTRIKGTGDEILADLSVIVGALKKSFTRVGNEEDIAKELIMDAVKRGFMSHEEIKKQVDEAEEFLKDIEKILDDVQKGIGINE